MKYPVNNYVEAFYQLFAGASEAEGKRISGNFLKLLEKTGDIKNAKKIFDLIHRKMVNKNGGKWISIETARKLSESRANILQGRFSGKDHVEFRINPDLVAGVRITIDGEEELDNSLNNKLNKLLK